MAKKLPSERSPEEQLTERWQIALVAYEHANSLAMQTISKYIEVGMHLVALRAEYSGDKEFGQARREWLPNMSKTWCSRLMKVARDPRLNAPALQELSISHLVELSSKDDDYIEGVVKQVEGGSTPTVKELRGAPAPSPSEPEDGVDDGPATTPPTPAPEPEDDPSPPAGDTDSMGVPRAGRLKEAEGLPEKNHIEEVQDIVDRPFPSRVEWAEDNRIGVEHWVILGLSPYFDIWPNGEVVEAVHEYLMQNVTDEQAEWLDWALNAAIDEINR